MRLRVRVAAIAAAASFCGTALAQDAPTEVEELRRRMAEMEQRYEKRISDLERRLGERGATPAPQSALQEQIDDLLDRVDSIDDRVGAATPRAGGGVAFRLVDVSMNALISAGTSTGTAEQVLALQAHGHDPRRRGFTVQNVEVVLKGAVDPYFNAQMNLVTFIDPEGETGVELEEAFATTSSLPARLQLKAGQYFTVFGRHTPEHPHQWEFVDAPAVSARYFGEDGMRGPGARVSWLAPVDFPLEVNVGAQNANGETMVPFLGTEEEEPPFGAFVEREVRTFDDLAYTARVAASVDATDEMPLLFGISRAWGPSGASSSGSHSVTGADFTLKWKPLDNDHGFTFVNLRVEWLRRHIGFDSFAAGSTVMPGGRLDDSGFYAQLVWGFMRSWTAGLRYDRVDGDFDDVLGLDDRDRWSLALTHYTSEFAKIRLQVNHDESDALPKDVWSVWLQIEFNLGAHGAHKF